MRNTSSLNDSASVRKQDALPRWDLTALYPGLDTPEFERDFEQLSTDVADLAAMFDADGIGRDGADLSLETMQERLEAVIAALNDVEDRLQSIQAYIYGHVSTNSRDELAQARLSKLQLRSVDMSKLQTRFHAWVGELPVDALIARSALAASHAYPLRQLHRSARHLMSPAEEALAAELAPSAGAAWAKLHRNLTSQITAPVEIEGAVSVVPMSALRNLALDADRSVRERAWRAELSAWEANALPIAAALNGVKGEVLTISARQGWDEPLSESLFWSGIDREILDVMVQEARHALPAFRHYLRLKARVLAVSNLAWYDLFAPVGTVERAWTWPEATRFLETQFATFSERMAGLARRAFRERWIDAEPRPGKVGGAYCMWLTDDQSRILANYAPSYDGVTTLAHELGHAYHNLTEEGLTPLQRHTPMILAETASTFCETLIKESALVEADAGERLYILEQSLQGSCQIVVDILSRFAFEQEFFAARRARELSVSELNALMLDAQQATYGDGLATDARHPYMWAVKGHYYSPGRSYYNYPYLFGLLFGLGLFAVYQREPGSFPGRYDALLAGTGLASAADLAGQFGIDLRRPEFWRSSLDVVRADIERFAALVSG